MVRIYLADQEYDRLMKVCKGSLCKSLSDFGRRQLMTKPVIMQYRNRSADEAVEASIVAIAALKESLGRPSWTEEEKVWLRAEISKLEEATLKIFGLCLPQ